MYNDDNTNKKINKNKIKIKRIVMDIYKKVNNIFAII